MSIQYLFFVALRLNIKRKAFWIYKSE